MPTYEYTGQRDTLVRWADAKGEEGLATYQCEKNARSIDGLVTPLGHREEVLCECEGSLIAR